jgi:hypothetical protein
MRPTLVIIGPRMIGERQLHHGDELPDGLLSQEQVDKMLDEKLLAEIPERRSLYKIFAAFSGVKQKQQLDAEELCQFELP